MWNLRDRHARELSIAQSDEVVGGPVEIRLNPTTGQLVKNYNKMKDRKEIAKMIVMGCLFFTFASSEAFIHYIQAIYNPMFTGIPRSTYRADIFRLHAQYIYYLSEILKKYFM